MSVFTSVADVAAHLAALPNPGRIVVGIAGSPGSGKTTVAAELVTLLAPHAQLLPMDGFHLPQARLVELGRRDRMGAPDTFDVDAYVATLAEVRCAFGAGPATSGAGGVLGNSGHEVRAPGFDREIEEAVPAAISISPEFAIIITEGNYLLLGQGGWQGVAPLLDETFFVRVDHDLRIERLVARHALFGKSPEAARSWATGTDERNAELIEASAGSATHTIALG